MNGFVTDCRYSLSPDSTPEVQITLKLIEGSDYNMDDLAPGPVEIVPAGKADETDAIVNAIIQPPVEVRGDASHGKPMAYCPPIDRDILWDGDTKTQDGRDYVWSGTPAQGHWVDVTAMGYPKGAKCVLRGSDQPSAKLAPSNIVIDDMRRHFLEKYRHKPEPMLTSDQWLNGACAAVWLAAVGFWIVRWWA